MVNLTQSWAEAYMKKYPGIFIQVTGGGSGNGIAALMNGSTDIAAVSRDLNPKEIENGAKKGLIFKEIPVAKDAIAIIVNKNNKINSLSLSQLGAIFSGKIRNFSLVGGSNLGISIYSRENNSGTYEFFKKNVLSGNDFASFSLHLQGTAALAEAVSKDIKGIGYGGIGYFAKRKDVKIINLIDEENEFEIQNLVGINGQINYDFIWQGGYSFSRDLNFVTSGKESELIQHFLDFVISEEGQKIVFEMEYIPLKKFISAE